MLVTVPKWVGGSGLQVTGELSEAERTRSRARTLVDSGGSLMCDASVGSDQRDGEVLKMVVDECERMEPKYILRGTSAEVRAHVAEEPECVMLEEEVLGRGGGEPSLSSSWDAGVKWPARDGRLNFHAVVLGGVSVTSGSSARAVRGATPAVERLEPRLWEVGCSGLRRKVEVEDAGLCARCAAETGAEGRRGEKPRWMLRIEEEAEKMPCELRDLRGAEVLLGVSAREDSCVRGTRG